MLTPQDPISNMTNSSVSEENRKPGQNSFGADLDDLRKMHILIVDDVPDNIELAEAMLRKSGFRHISTAEGGEEALELAEKAHSSSSANVDIILLDVMMPKVDGYEVCRRLRNRDEFRDIPVIMITANAMWRDEIARVSMDVGATDIMFKPVRRATLMPRVISALLLKKERDLRKLREVELETELAERKVMEARLQYLVSHDDLTGLSNRRHLEQALEIAVIQAEHHRHSSALFYIDLDQFKVVNDLEGHAMGDRLLVSIAHVLRHEVNEEDILSRISSDEYAVLIHNTNEDEARERAEQTRKALDEFRFNADGRTYHTGASIGVSLLVPEEKITASEMLARADQACFEAKTHGRNKVHMYHHEDNEVHVLRNSAYWVPKIREALAENKFKLLFQPVMAIDNYEINRYEALIRMDGDEGDLITPNHFIPIAESMGLIHDIDLWVVKHAFEILHNLPESHSNLALNINLSSHAFQDPALLPLVQEKLDETGIEAKRIVFEITETAAVANYEQTRDMVISLRKLGCGFALDDFGAGFNSFNYLKHFPVDYLKIDGSFITNLINDPVDQTLVKSMIKIARTLGKQTVAEFVEDAEVLKMLQNYGVDYAQGYYIGRPDKEFLTKDAHSDRAT